LSPDGKQIAFTDLLKKKNQIFILSMEGGEPIQLTKDKYGASKWSPDGKKILFSSSIPLRDLLQDSIESFKIYSYLENGKAWF
jgi:Tol biopolymer transport system component